MSSVVGSTDLGGGGGSKFLAGRLTQPQAFAAFPFALVLLANYLELYPTSVTSRLPLNFSTARVIFTHLDISRIMVN